MRILITGASGQLGAYLVRQLTPTDDVVAWTGVTTGELFGCQLVPVDITAESAVRSAFQQVRPDVVIHTAALTAVQDCFQDPASAEAINVGGSAILAKLAARANVRLVHVSTDMVFDGRGSWYTEDDRADPVSVYGRSKLAAEDEVLSFPQHAVVRVSWMFGPALHERRSFFDRMLSSVRSGEALTLFADEWRTPLSLRTAAIELARLAHSSEHGLFHLGGPERMSRLEMGQRLMAFLGADPQTVQASQRSDVAFDEPRPADLSLNSSRWRNTFPAARVLCWEDELLEMAVR